MGENEAERNFINKNIGGIKILKYLLRHLHAKPGYIVKSNHFFKRKKSIFIWIHRSFAPKKNIIMESFNNSIGLILFCVNSTNLMLIKMVNISSITAKYKLKFIHNAIINPI